MNRYRFDSFSSKYTSKYNRDDDPSITFICELEVMARIKPDIDFDKTALQLGKAPLHAPPARAAAKSVVRAGG